MITRENLFLRISFNWTREFSILIFSIAIVAAFSNTLVRLSALRVEAGMYYQPYLLRFGLTETFHVVYFIEFLPDVRSVIGFSELVKALVERTVDLTQTAYGVVLLGDRSTGLRLVASHNLNSELLKSWHLDENSLKHLQHSEVIERSLDSVFSILIPLSLPRQIKPELLGILALGTRTSGRGYSWEEKSALKKLGQEAGLAIYIAQLNKNHKSPS
jgi:hypothetical protein